MFQVCVPMVLQTLHMLASAPRMRAVAMRLLTALWKKQVCFEFFFFILFILLFVGHLYLFVSPALSFCLCVTDFVPFCKDRIYPELQCLLGQQENRVVVGRDAHWEQILARAVCIRDICRERSDRVV